VATTGATGATGAAGAAGPKGDKGDQGIQGIQGIQGNQGIQGDPGPAGPTVSASATGNSSTTVVSGTQTIASTNITLPAGVNTVVANAGFDWISDAAGSSTLGCQLGLDTTVAPFIQEGTSSSSPGFALTARFTGLSAGSHTVKLICINDGGTPAIGPNPTITAIGTGG
jgi:Collagen triple helix repeat (20 copies)